MLVKPYSDVGDSKLKGGENVKFVKFWEICPEDMDKGIPKFLKLLEEMKKNPGKYPRYILPPYGIGELFKGISILEADNEEQLISYILAVTPEFKIKFVPLIDSSKAIEMLMKTKA
ncbi:MAG: hypothetical protein QXT64_00210 [Desulfurococcaceae archaeon]